MTIAAIAYGSSLLEFDVVLASGGSLGLAASFLRPTSILFALAVCVPFLAGLSSDRGSVGALRDGAVHKDGGGESRVSRSVVILATGAYAIDPIHGGMTGLLPGIDGNPWHTLLCGRPGPRSSPPFRSRSP